MSATKMGESTTNILKLMFFPMNLHFVKSNKYLPIENLNLPVFLPLEMQKDSNWPKHTTRFLTLSKKKRSTNPSKWQLQNLFSPVCTLLVQLASMNVFYSMWYLEDITFRESLSLFWYFWSAMLLLSLQLVFWKKSPQ